MVIAFLKFSCHFLDLDEFIEIVELLNTNYIILTSPTASSLIQLNVLKCFSPHFVPLHSQNKRVNINKDELKSTSKAIETVHNLCCNENKGATELVAELGTLYQCIR